MRKDLLVDIKKTIHESRIWEDVKESEEFYKRMGQMSLKQQSILEFRRKTGSVMEYANSAGGLESFRIVASDDSIDNYNYIHFVLRNPTSKQKAVSVKTSTYKHCKDRNVFIIFAVQMASDPKYYEESKPRPTDEFMFYMVNPKQKYDTLSIGTNTYFRLDSLTCLEDVMNKNPSPDSDYQETIQSYFRQ